MNDRLYAEQAVEALEAPGGGGLRHGSQWVQV